MSGWLSSFSPPENDGRLRPPKLDEPLSRLPEMPTERSHHKRLAAIDIGTNTALLLVAEVRGGGELVPLEEVETIVRLGQGVDASRQITSEAVERTVAVLQQYTELAHSYGVAAIRCCATSALRDAANRDAVLRQIEAATGLEVEVLSGRREAELTYAGALSNKPDLRGRNLMVDIGGGSTELVFGTGRQVRHLYSVDIGSVRLTERFLRHDPVTRTELARLRQAVEEAFSPVLTGLSELSPEAVLGVAGTVTTLKAMDLGLAKYEPSQIDGQRLSAEAVAVWVDRLRRLAIAERARLPGLRPERADVILAGAVILAETLRLLRQPELIVSDRGLRYGMLAELLWQETGTE